MTLSLHRIRDIPSLGEAVPFNSLNPVVSEEGLKNPTTNESKNITRLIVIPAKARIQDAKATAVALDPRFREGDDTPFILPM